MNVWFARDKVTAEASRQRVAKNIHSVKTTFLGKGDTDFAIIDGEYPKSSHDKSILRWTSYGRQGKEQKVEIKLKKEQPIESIMVYWYEDNKGVMRPASWRAEYLHNGKWHDYKPYITDHFGVLIDQFNMVHPDKDIKAEAIRLIVTPQSGKAVGILEAIVE